MHLSLDPVRHTVSAFDNDLDTVRATIGQMGTLAQEALSEAMQALIGADSAMAERVIAGDEKIDALESALEKQVVQTIALRAPMADDLRMLVVAIRIGAMLERAGDHAKNIARRVATVIPRGLEAPIALLSEMGALAGSMIGASMEAYHRLDPALAGIVRERDGEMNERFEELTRVLVREMADEPRFVAAGIQLLFAGKQLERIGDYASNIADCVHFMATGEHLPNWDEGPAATGATVQ